MRRRIRGIVLRAAALGITALLLTACVPVPPGGPAHDDSGLSGSLTIFAAASLSASFSELAEEFGADNPAVTVNPISFDGSATLATQIDEGAPADVFASADESTMAKVAGEGDGSPAVFASNVLEIVGQRGNPLGITGLSDLARPSVQVVLCAPRVPCGTASHRILDLDGVAIAPVSEEQNVKAVLAKVQAGEADAGLVYVTDVAAAGTVDGVTIAGAERAANSYPIATLARSADPEVAEAFVAFVLSHRGQAILARYGFGKP